MLEYIEWSKTAREIPQEDQTDFFDTPLPHTTVFRYQTADFVLPLHSTHFSLKFTLKGVEDYQFKHRSVKLASGSCLFTNFGAEHGSSANEPVESVSIYFPKGLEDTLYASLQETVAQALEKGTSKTYREMPHVAFSPTARTQQQLYSLLSRLSDNHESDHGSELEDATAELAMSSMADVLNLAPPWVLADIVKSSVRDELLSRVMRARDFISDRAGLGYDIDEVADVACLSKYHLIRTFGEVVGETPGIYARRCRMEFVRTNLSPQKDWAPRDWMRAARMAEYSSSRRFKEAYLKRYGHDLV